MNGSELDDLVHRADLDALVRLVDGLTARRDWPGLLAVRDRCRAAVASGRQLWPVATLAEFRLALWGDDTHCAMVLDDDTSGRFTIGPLTEVAAQHHSLQALAANGLTGPRLGFVAHERALRGELPAGDIDDPLGLPFALQPWEPTYLLATYDDDGVDAPAPPVPAPLVPAPGRATGVVRPVIDDVDVDHAVRELLGAWTQSSDGRVEVIGVDGSVPDALATLGVGHPRLGRLDGPQALQWLAWAGASGGAHGRRRGAAAGRFGTWWLVATLGGLTDEWPARPDDLGAVQADLEWWWWDAGEPPLGWQLHLAVHDPHTGESWVINANDAA